MLAKWRIVGLSAKVTALAKDRYELLNLAIDSTPSSGLWLEFGVFRGESINYMADRTHHPIVGFDSFEGLPGRWSPRFGAGDLSTGGGLPRVRPEVSLIKGWFSETIPRYFKLHSDEKVAFLHVDCDLYSSTQTVLKCLRGRISDGAVIVFDEFCGLMPDDEARAWREHCRENPLAFRWLGASLTGSVALKVISSSQSSQS